MFHVFFLFFFFLQFYEHPDLGKNIFTTWNVLKSEVYLTCINFRKFNDDLKASLEVIKLPSWPKNVKFSVKMQFFTFLTPWKIHLELMTNLKLSFSEVDLEVFTFPKNHYLYIKIWTSSGYVLKKLQITFCPQIQQEKSKIKIWPAWAIHNWNCWNFYSQWDYQMVKISKIFDLTWIR